MFKLLDTVLQFVLFVIGVALVVMGIIAVMISARLLGW